MRISVSILLILALSIHPVAGASQATVQKSPSETVTTTPLQQVSNESLFERVETDGSSFVAKLNISLLTSFFQPGTVLRVTTGGAVNGQRVIWLDIGVGRDSDGFKTRVNTMIDMPGMAI